MLYITKTFSADIYKGTTLEIEEIPNDMVSDLINGWKSNIRTFGYVDEDTIDALGIKLNMNSQYPSEGDHILLIENDKYYLLTLDYVTAPYRSKFATI